MSGPLMQLLFLKVGCVSGSIYKNVVLKKKANKNDKSMSKNWSPACPFDTWHCSNPQILNSSIDFVKCIVAPSVQPKPGTVRFFFFFPKLNKNNYLVGDIGREVHLGLWFSSFFLVYPKMSMKTISKIGLKDLKRCVQAKCQYLKGN